MGRNKKLKERIAALEQRLQRHQQTIYPEKRRTAPRQGVDQARAYGAKQLEEADGPRQAMARKAKVVLMSRKRTVSLQVSQRALRALPKGVSGQSRNYDKAFERRRRAATFAVFWVARSRKARVEREGQMDGIISVIDHNGLWLMIIAVVGITAWFRYRERELKVQQEMRLREMEHLQRMKELELELERAKAKQMTQNA